MQCLRERSQDRAVLIHIVYWEVKSSKLPTCYHWGILESNKEGNTELKFKMRTRPSGSAF